MLYSLHMRSRTTCRDESGASNMSRDEHIARVERECGEWHSKYLSVKGQLDATIKERDEARAGRWPLVVNQLQNLMAALNAKQAQIDSLMWEFCPGEMSEAQKRNYARHQRPVSAEQEAEVEAALAAPPENGEPTR
jgi:hypothetical protein